MRRLRLPCTPTSLEKARRAALSFLLIISVSCGATPTAFEPGVSGDWPTAPPESQGLSSSVLQDFSERIEGGEFGLTNSLLIVRNGFLVWEEYFNGATQADVHTMYSVTKSVTSALIGIAVGGGSIPNLDVKVLDLFPEYANVENMSPDKESMTLRHVLQMRTGIEWDEWSTAYTTPTNPTTALVQSADWMKHMLDLPLSEPPGTDFTYNSGATMILSGILLNTTGLSAEAFADSVLFGPLGIEDYDWWTGPNRISNTGWGLNLKPQDMLKFGFLFLRDGVWEGERLLSSEWIDESIEPYSTFNWGGSYGYQWWVDAPLTIAGQDLRVPSARGWGGQYILFIPEIDVVAVSTGENFSGGGLLPATIASHIERAIIE